MPSITYNGHTIESVSTERSIMRKALATAERESLDAAVEAADVPRGLIRKWCDEADVEPGSAKTARRLNENGNGQIIGGDGAAAEGTGGIEFFDPAQVAAARRGGAFLAIYKGSAGGFRFSTAAASLMGLEDGDQLVFAQDAGEERTHVFIGVKSDGRKTEGGKGATLNISKNSRGFSCVPLAQMLGISKPEQGRRLIIESEPVERAGIQLWKALLQKPKEESKEEPSDD